MKSRKQQKEKGEQGSMQHKNLTKDKKPRRSSRGKLHKSTDVPSTPCVISPDHHIHCTSDKETSPGTVSQMISDIKHKDEQMPHPSPKIKLQLFPVDERIRKGLEEDGHYPFLELTLRARKKICSVLKHLGNKWGSSSIARGELMLFPFNIVVSNLNSYRRWTSDDIGISAGDVHAAVGSPEIFRLRYGWIPIQLNSSSSLSPSLSSLPDCREPSHMERLHCSTKEATSSTQNHIEVKATELKSCHTSDLVNLAADTSGAKNHIEVKNRELKPCHTSEVANEEVHQTVSAEPATLAVCMSQTEVESEEFKQRNAFDVEKVSLKEKPSAETFKSEEPKMDATETSFLWSDISNISIGGLLSEASLQGRFNTQDTRLGSSKSASQPTTINSNSHTKIQTETKNMELKPCHTSEVENKETQPTISAEPLNLAVQMHQTEVKSDELKQRNAFQIEQVTLKEKPAAEPLNPEEQKMDTGDTSFLWSDLSNISIGGLLSEASLQGRFNTQDTRSRGRRSASHPTTINSDSLDAFADQLNRPQAFSTLSSVMPSSILDAEDTCHSFAFSKPSLGKDFLSLGQRPFSGLSSQDAASRPFKYPKFEANAQDGASAIGSNTSHQEPNTDTLPCSVGLFNNENSIGLSSIRWNDSLGPFDLPLTPRQVIKDDSISIGGFVR